MLDIDTELSIYNEIKRTDFDFAFYVSSESDSTYSFKLVRCSKNEMVSRTNRKLFVNDRYYPIIFNTDYIFYSKTSKNMPLVAKSLSRYSEKEVATPPIDERYKNKDTYSRMAARPLWHNYAYWVVDIHGKIIETNTEP